MPTLLHSRRPCPGRSHRKPPTPRSTSEDEVDGTGGAVVFHTRSTNPIESTFATVRHRTKITRGPGSRAAGLAMAFKLVEAAQARWRAVNAPHLVALVRAGAVFQAGKLVERPEPHAKPTAA